eukprot:5138322-Prorocentrum_lima.AAC.1
MLFLRLHLLRQKSKMLRGLDLQICCLRRVDTYRRDLRSKGIQRGTFQTHEGAQETEPHVVARRQRQYPERHRH